MKINSEWSDYEIIATGNGEKLERWKDVVLLRPDPQVIWPYQTDITKYKINAKYIRSDKGGGEWGNFISYPAEWTVSWRNLIFKIKPMGFKHTGLFPEQAANWDSMINLIADANRPINVLNLFAYTGGATLACISAGANVCHVDAAKGMVDRALENVKLSKLDITKARFIIDDCLKFVQREIRRGKKYDAIIMDPPSYGRGPNGEMWKLEDNLFELVKTTVNVLSDNPLFYLINSYTTGLQPAVLNNILKIALKKYGGTVESYEVALPTKEGIVLPCGASGLWFK